MNLITRSCPCCNSINELINPELIGNISNESNLLAKNFNWETIAKSKNYFNYYRCQNCGLLYCKYYLDKNNLSKLYKNMSDNMSDVEISNRVQTQNNYVKQIYNLNLIDGDYLELGPDIGLFLRIILHQKKFSKLKEFYLVEPNLQSHSSLKFLLNNKKFSLSENIDDFDYVPDNTISLAVAIHVIDHLLEPSLAISNIYQKLKKGGYFIIVIHNEKSLLAKMFRYKWPAYCVQHPQLYNKKSISILLNRQGFEIVNIKNTVNFFNIFYLLDVFLKIFGIHTNFKKIKINLGLKLGNFIVIAKK
jgi:hypothetical protein